MSFILALLFVRFHHQASQDCAIRMISSLVLMRIHVPCGWNCLNQLHWLEHAWSCLMMFECLKINRWMIFWHLVLNIQFSSPSAKANRAVFAMLNTSRIGKMVLVEKSTLSYLILPYLNTYLTLSQSISYHILMTRKRCENELWEAEQVPLARVALVGNEASPGHRADGTSPQAWSEAETSQIRNFLNK